MPDLISWRHQLNSTISHSQDLITLEEVEAEAIEVITEEALGPVTEETTTMEIKMSKNLESPYTAIVVDKKDTWPEDA